MNQFEGLRPSGRGPAEPWADAPNHAEACGVPWARIKGHMRRWNLSHFTLCTPIATASCSANSSTAPPLSRPAWQREAPAAIRVGVYVGQASYNSVIFGYRARNKSNRAPECSIAYQNFAQSQIAVDASGNVFAVGKNGIFYGVGGTHVSVCTRSGCISELTDSSIKQLETGAGDAQGTVWA